MNKPNSKKRLELAQRRDAPLATRTDLSAAAVKDISGTMNAILADVFALYVKTKNFHWHMSGPHFRDYHLLLDDQADQLFAMTDPIAERVRKLGGITLHSIGEIARTQRDLANRVQRDSPKLSDPLSDWICHGEKLVGLVVEKQMVIAKVRAAHVPVEIFRLHIEREHIGENRVHRSAYIFD